jgi:hypothetical protein
LSTFTVTNTGDSGPGSLRQAILDANAATGATNTIDFKIPGQGVQTIAPLSPLTAITQAVVIDGYSQPGYAGLPLIEINGSQAGGGDGLTITGLNVNVRGLDVNNFSQGAGIHITGSGATGDWIYGNLLGTDPTGTQAEPDNVGVQIDGGATYNLIGTDGDGRNDAAERNVVSGNQFAGIWINGQGTDGNAVAGNFIGTSATGDVALANGSSPQYDSNSNAIGGGCVIEGGASGNRIGTDGTSADDAGERNLVSGNSNNGIEIHGSGTSRNIVAGNYIGTDETGSLSLGNTGDGVYLLAGASSNWIGVNPLGGTAVRDEANVISGNGSDGVLISANANSNVVAGDRIGTDATGEVALGNGGDEVNIVASSGETIGGTGAGEANVISGSGISGVELVASSENLVEGDFIGTDATGTKALGNSGAGVEIGADADGPSTDNTIGGTSATAGNLITDNGGPGVVVGSSPGEADIGNEITANRIFGNTGQAIDLGDDGVTDNNTAARGGPNNLQNFPVIVTTAGGQFQGWLGGCLPETTYRVELFASAVSGPGGAGEAEDYLGSLEVTTNATGQVTFAIPFTAPAELPIITGTVTDPQGNTSEVSALRRATLGLPDASLRVVPDQALSFSTPSSDGIAIQDPDAGPLNPAWNLTLSVVAGTLTLSTTAGLVGSGDGTGSLSYSGPLSAVDAALKGMTFGPPAASHILTPLTLEARSSGAPPLEAQLLLTDGVFVVNTTADSGPGSLRQAILDANRVTAGTVAIDFAISGVGPHTIALQSPLPAISTPVLIDGTTQPGYAGTPLIALDFSATGSPDDLAISGSEVTLSGLATSEFGLGQEHQSSTLVAANRQRIV